MSERNFWRMGKNDVKDKVREMGDKRWQEEIQGKSSLKIYEEEKKEIKEELMYDNRPCSIIMYSVENLFPTFSPQERKNALICYIVHICPILSDIGLNNIKHKE